MYRLLKTDGRILLAEGAPIASPPGFEEYRFFLVNHFTDDGRIIDNEYAIAEMQIGSFLITSGYRSPERAERETFALLRRIGEKQVKQRFAQIAVWIQNLGHPYPLNEIPNWLERITPKKPLTIYKSPLSGIR